MATIHRVSTAAVPPAQRLAFWNDACVGAYGPLVVDTDPDGFQGVLTRLCAGQLEITSVKSTPAVISNAARPARVGGDERVFSLQLVRSGRCRIRHAGVETVAETGDMIVADGGKTYDLAFDEPVEGLVLSPPWARFGGHADMLEALCGRPINVKSGPGAVLSTFIRSAWDHLGEGEDGAWPQSAADVIWDLLASVLQSGAGAITGRPDALRREARSLIDRRLGDAGFQTPGIAQALGVSARYLQAVFAEVGTTPSRFLLARRLDVAAARLRRPGAPSSITDVALECGFNDLSYFSRAFRRRFGVSAGGYRRTSGAPSADWL